MKILNLLVLTGSMLLGMCACDDEEITMTPAISFKESAVSVIENEESLTVPIKLSAPITGTVYLFVSIQEGSEKGGEKGINYVVPAYITLGKDAVKGNYNITIIDDEYPNDDRTFVLTIKEVQGAAVKDIVNQSCTVTVVDDDQKDKVTVGFDSLAMKINEDVGIFEVPVTLKGLLSDFLSFTVTTTNGTAIAGVDYELLSPEIKAVQGENWTTVSLRIIDSKATKEDRSFKLNITGIKGVNEQDTTVAIRENAKICDITIKKIVREVKFENPTLLVSESAKPFNFPIMLTAPIDKDVKIKIKIKEGGTAIEGVHFTIDTKELTIRKGETIANAKITVIDNKLGNTDRFCEFEIVEITAGAELSKDHASTKLILENDDSSVGFKETSAYAWKGNTINIPIEMKGLHDQRVIINVAIKADQSVQEFVHYMLLDKQVVMQEGDSVAFVRVATLNPSDDTFKFDLEITKISGIGLETPVILDEQIKICKIGVFTDYKWEVTGSSEETPNGNEGGFAYIIDGNQDTYWHSNWQTPAQLPHWIVIDMKQEMLVDQIEFWRRPGNNGDIKTCFIEVSTDGENYEQVDEYHFNGGEGKTEENKDKYRITKFPSRKMQYIKCRVTESNRPPFAGIGEIKVNYAPVVK